jgi:hypothetical protein
LGKVFKEIYVQDLSRMGFDLGLSDEQLYDQIKNSLGVQSALFIPEKCFYQLSVDQIERLRYPSLRCLELAHKGFLYVIVYYFL